MRGAPANQSTVGQTSRTRNSNHQGAETRPRQAHPEGFDLHGNVAVAA